MKSISEFMEQDHDRLDDLFNNFKELKIPDENKAKEIFAEFKSDLEKHINWEEEFLFPLFEQKTGMFNSGPTAVMKIEHKNIKDILRQISEKLISGSMQTDELDKTLVTFLSNHNQKEEDILYPMIDKSFNETEVKEFYENIKKISPEE